MPSTLPGFHVATPTGGGGRVVLSYGGGVPSERSAVVVSPEVAGERLLFRKAIGVMVHDMRIGEGISQTVLADRVGVSRWTISDMELGKSAIASDVLFSILRALADFPVDMREIFEMRFDENWCPRVMKTDSAGLRRLTLLQRKLRNRK